MKLLAFTCMFALFCWLEAYTPYDQLIFAAEPENAVDVFAMSDCDCRKHECDCKASRNNIEVTVNLVYNECSCCKTKRICGDFKVKYKGTTVEFSDCFQVNTPIKPSYTDEKTGTKYSFWVDISEEEKNGKVYLPGSLRITQPVTIDLGKFSLPV